MGDEGCDARSGVKRLLQMQRSTECLLGASNRHERYRADSVQTGMSSRGNEHNAEQFMSPLDHNYIFNAAQGLART